MVKRKMITHPECSNSIHFHAGVEDWILDSCQPDSLNNPSPQMAYPQQVCKIKKWPLKCQYNFTNTNALKTQFSALKHFFPLGKLAQKPDYEVSFPEINHFETGNYFFCDFSCVSSPTFSVDFIWKRSGNEWRGGHDRCSKQQLQLISCLFSILTIFQIVFFSLNIKIVESFQ